MQFGDVETFLTGNSDVCPSSKKKLLDILQNSPKHSYLMLEFASIVDWGGALCEGHLQARR